MPMRLDDGWNQIQFNLSDFTRRAYGTNYIETLRVEVDTPPIKYLPFNHQMCLLLPFKESTEYITSLSLPQIHANCRIRRVYFSDRLYSEDELPAEFKLYLPVQNKSASSPAKVPFTIFGQVVASYYSVCGNPRNSLWYLLVRPCV